MGPIMGLFLPSFFSFLGECYNPVGCEAPEMFCRGRKYGGQRVQITTASQKTPLHVEKHNHKSENTGCAAVILAYDPILRFSFALQGKKFPSNSYGLPQKVAQDSNLWRSNHNPPC